ncbi:MAG TPA: RNA-binding protein [Sutterella sp.]|jgi:ribosome-associated heat shock protein Hsp15|nr:RNA-binding protein [Sutterella sp.]
MTAELTSVRIDKWLWAARFFKTRSLAQDAVELGRVRVDGQRIKPSREVRGGEMLMIERSGERIEIRVAALSVVRGPASVAQKLYEETEESRQRRERLAAMRKLASEPALAIPKGRPTKRDARALRRFREGWDSGQD